MQGKKKVASSSIQALNPALKRSRICLNWDFLWGKQNNSNAWLTCLSVGWLRVGEIMLCLGHWHPLKKPERDKKRQVLFVYSACKDSYSSLAGHNNLEKQVLLWLTWVLAAFV